jgi:hypothetical protein
MGYPIDEKALLKGRHVLDPSNQTLALLDGDALTLIRLNERSFTPIKVDAPMLAVKLSPTGVLGLGIGKDKALYRMTLANGFKPEKLLGTLGWEPEVFTGYRRDTPEWSGFSADGNRIFASTAEGRIFTWPVDGTPRQLMKLPKLRTVTYARWDADKTHIEEEVPASIPPIVGITATAKWLYAIDGDGHLFVVNPKVSIDQEPTPVLILQSGPVVVASARSHS